MNVTIKTVVGASSQEYVITGDCEEVLALVSELGFLKPTQQVVLDYSQIKENT